MSRVVFPEPRKPLMRVTGSGAMVDIQAPLGWAPVCAAAALKRSHGEGGMQQLRAADGSPKVTTQ